MNQNTHAHPFIIVSSPSDAEYIDNKLVEFNNQQVQFTQKNPFINLNYVINDGDTIVAGINAALYCWNILYINVLWVDENYRKHGYGSLLLKKVEEEARAAGSKLAHLDTFDFQAKDFYLKHGYVIFGVLENCPPGHKRFYLKKVL